MADEDRREYWDSIHSRHELAGTGDEWAVEVLSAFPDIVSLLELGCGRGALSQALVEAGYRVHATDISPVAVELTKRRCDKVVTRAMDHSGPLPFDAGSFDAVIADLSLHYFDWKTTVAAVGEIRRVLRPSGILAGRVNSNDDKNYGAGHGTEVEPGLFVFEGHYKRFFDRSMLKAMLLGFETIEMSHREINRYGRVKRVRQFMARKKG